MHDLTNPRLPKWPFCLGDTLLLVLAFFIQHQSDRPMTTWQISLMVLCVALGAVLIILPFVLEYRVVARLAEASGLATVVAQIQNLEQLAAQITSATARWQTVQEAADQTSAGAREIVTRLGSEVAAFGQFLERANETEKATLRLEVDKLRRAEGEWLQVLVRILDHVYAVHQGALRSGQPSLIDQLGHFQNACRDVARRVGLTPFIAGDAEPFDGQRHQLMDADGKAPEGALVESTIAAGYTFQGRMLRPALVRLRANGSAEPPVLQPENAQP
jgi:molecular chaperone GrpE (heat shock protein)